MRYLIVGAAITGGLASGGCEPCGLVGSTSGLQIEVANIPGEGAYRLDLHADGQRLTIDYSVMGDGSVICVEQCDARSSDFTLAPADVWVGVPSLSVDSARFVVRRLDEPDLGPDNLEALVTRDQVVVFDDTFAVEYSKVAPNGERCGEHYVGGIRVDLAR